MKLLFSKRKLKMNSENYTTIQKGNIFEIYKNGLKIETLKNLAIFNHCFQKGTDNIILKTHGYIIIINLITKYRLNLKYNLHLFLYNLYSEKILNMIK